MISSKNYDRFCSSLGKVTRDERRGGGSRVTIMSKPVAQRHLPFAGLSYNRTESSLALTSKSLHETTPITTVGNQQDNNS